MSENGQDGNGTEHELEAIELPLVAIPGTHPCHNCGDCCSYIATEIDNPTTFPDYENIYWYLTHKNISVYIDDEDDWFIEFRTQCEHLTEAKSCAIYQDRPKICSEFSWNDCEKNTDERAWKYYFSSYQDLLDWMEKRRPKAYETYMKNRRKLLRQRERNNASVETQAAAKKLVPIADSAAETPPEQSTEQSPEA